MTMLNADQAQRVADAIAEVERRTDAELVTVLARRADDYQYIPALWAALAALVSPGVVLFTPFWLDVAEVLMIQLAVFLALALLLRLPSVLPRIIPASVKRWRAANLARRAFLDNNLHHTDGETGLLIFVAETERYVTIIADRGIDRFVDASEWQAIVDEFTSNVRGGRTLDGFLTAIEQCGAILAKHVPPTREKDELPNHLIIL